MLALAASWLNAESISAIASASATVLLALFTWRLAVQTRNLAGETEADVRANWRPIIISDRPVVIEMADVNADRFAFSCYLVNVGAGPALNGYLKLFDRNHGLLDITALRPMPPQTRVGYKFDNLPVDLFRSTPITFTVEVESEDVGERLQQTVFTYVIDIGGPIVPVAAQLRGLQVEPSRTKIDPEPKPPIGTGGRRELLQRAGFGRPR